MNCRKSIFKFLGIAAVCAASAACSVDDADDLALVKLGALEKEFVVEADANTFDIDIYANGAFHIERIGQADWISLTCGETVDGKGAITAECEFNEGFKRKAGFVLCSDVDARRDTLYVKQKALVDAKIEFANSSVTVAGAGGENTSPIETNVPFEAITVDIEYAKADNADWIKNLEIVDSESEKRSLVITTETNTADEIPRSAAVSLSFTDGWDETVSVEFNLLQRTAKETLGRQITFEEFRQTYATNKKVDDYVILEGIVVSNTKNHNAGENPQNTTSKIDYTMSDRTVYLETYDGKYGIAVQTASAGDNVFEQYDHVQILIQGASGYLVENPDRYELRNVTKAMVISRIAGSASDVPVKEKWMNQLTDDDIYTYVTLKDVEFPRPQGRDHAHQRGLCDRHERRPHQQIPAARARHQRRRHVHDDQHQLRLPQRRHAPALRLGQDLGRHRPRAFLAFRMARRSRPCRNGRRPDARLHRPLPDPPPDQGRHLGQHAEQCRRQLLGSADGVPLLESRRGEQGPETHLRNERLPDAHLPGEVHGIGQQRVPAKAPTSSTCGAAEPTNTWVPSATTPPISSEPTSATRTASAS